ncbi:TM2 domain-containing protein [Duganella sp. sic0402]|uniref:NINE protein n=1 Tax=Duganella sp. sic0402 TaxID=2854786 RepID=UPI001C43C352|nr:TM2 domain-containing protein [Duganella sp. sic0402]MBV7536148.1 TM2 domain-containing protein [Duganella sp. sic0402]
MTVLHPVRHKNKTIAALLAFLLGGIGLHRLYLRGWRDPWLWLHLACLPAAWLVATLAPQADGFYKLLPVMLSGLAGMLQALILGLTADEKWDPRYNPASGRQSDTRWPVAVVLVASMMIGAGGLIATISRLFDLLYTGGAYG